MYTTNTSNTHDIDKIILMEFYVLRKYFMCYIWSPNKYVAFVALQHYNPRESAVRQVMGIMQVGGDVT